MDIGTLSSPIKIYLKEQTIIHHPANFGKWGYLPRYTNHHSSDVAVRSQYISSL